jgi:hypothetical protein
MSISDRMSIIKEWLAQRERERALSAFTCGHCSRQDQCGREPSADCIEKLEQISQGDDWRHRARAAAVARLPYS